MSSECSWFADLYNRIAFSSSCVYHLPPPKGANPPWHALYHPEGPLSVSLSLSLPRSQVGSQTSLTRTKHRVQTTQCHPRGSLQRLQVTCRIRTTLQSRNIHPVVPPLHQALPPSHPHCPAKEHLLRWRPLLTTETSLSTEDLEKHYQLTTLAWEPSTLTSYMSGLLVFHTWGDSRNLLEDQRAPVTQDTISTFITDLAGTYARDTIANYMQGLQAWHRIYNIPWNIDELHIHTMLKGARKVTPEAAKLPK